MIVVEHKEERPQLHKWNSFLSKDAYVDVPKKRRKSTTLTVQGDGSVKDSVSIIESINKASQVFFEELESPKTLSSLRQSSPVQARQRASTTQVEITTKVQGRTRSGSLGDNREIDLLPPLIKRDTSDFLCLEGSKAKQPQKKITLAKSETINRLLEFQYYSNDSDLLMSFSHSITPVIIGGTKSKLLEVLTESGISDNNFIKEFLFTYTYFTSCVTILSWIENRLQTKQIPDMIKKHLLERRYEELNIKRLQYIIFYWMDNHPTHFHMFGTCQQLKRILKLFDDSADRTKLLACYRSKVQSCVLPRISERPTAAIQPNPLAVESCEVLAKALCRLDQTLFFQIPIEELKEQKWSKKNPHLTAPFVTKCIEMFNRISYCCATWILSHENVKDRTKALVKIIRLAEKCFEYKGYNAAFSAMSSLNSCVVDRLKKTWKGVSPKYMAKFERLTELSSPQDNYKEYKSHQFHQTSPMVPYLGVFLRDLTFVEVGNPTYFDESKGVVNFDKLRMLATIYQNIISYQQVPFSFSASVEIGEAFMYSLPAKDEETLYEISTQLEPIPATETQKKQSLFPRILHSRKKLLLKSSFETH